MNRSHFLAGFLGGATAFALIGLVVAIGVGAFVLVAVLGSDEPESGPTYSEFLDQARAGDVEAVTLNVGENTAEVTPAEGEEYETAYPSNTEQSLINTLRAEEVPVEVENP